MNSMAKHDPEDLARIKSIEERLLANPELASLIDELATSTHDANDLVRGLLQASINRGLQAEMDVHLGYEHSDREGKAAVGTDNSRKRFVQEKGRIKLRHVGNSNSTRS